jgi:hypothetical protein
MQRAAKHDAENCNAYKEGVSKIYIGVFPQA